MKLKNYKTMDNDETVSVIIINFNSGKYIFNCIECLQNQTYKNIEILILDNNSKDGSSAQLELLSKEYHYFYHYFNENLGFSKANNYGISKSNGKYILLLNADAFPQPDYIQKCIKQFTYNNQIGIVIGKLLSADDAARIDSAGILLNSKGVALERGHGEIDEGQYNQKQFIFGACAAAAFYRRQMLEDIKIDHEYFDEIFFAFYEDVDVSARSILYGWKTLYYPEAICYHKRGGSTDTIRDWVKYVVFRNRNFFRQKTLNKSIKLLDRFILYLQDLRILMLGKNFLIRYLSDKKHFRYNIKKKRNHILQRADFSLLQEYFLYDNNIYIDKNK